MSESTNATLSSVADAHIDSFLRLAFADSSCANCKVIYEQFLSRKRFGSYWTQTETYESLKTYITMNYDGLKDAVLSMLGGMKCEIDTKTFQNDMTTFHSKDDVLTLLVHLGYLAYDVSPESVFIPNQEVKEEFLRSIKNADSHFGL